MIKMKLFAYLFAGVLLTSCSESDGPIEVGLIGEATYTVTFTMHWNSQDFPTDYPSNAHFSKLIGWSHKTTSEFFMTGTTASAGIESMAETGATDVLQSELETRIASAEGLQWVVGDGLSAGTGEISVDILVNADNPAVTLATMVAPSPDWYVAVVNVDLLDTNKFVDSKTITAQVYDAGTDDGITYTSADADSSPKVPISLFVDAPLGDGNSLPTAFASVTFTKQ